jgi:hypothetical protein
MSVKRPDMSSITLRATLGFDDSPTTKAQHAQKENTKMSGLNREFAEDVITHTPKRGVVGIGGTDNQGRMVSTLQRLGLVPSDLAVSLQTLAAHNSPVSEFLKIKVWDLDRELAKTDASLENRMSFKLALSRAGILVAK